MSEKKKLVDVWIQEGNTVYKDVPYTVVVDWVQEGRLLEDDQVRIAGTEKWHRLGSTSAFAPYLPKAEPNRAEDQAEALEPVELGFTWKQKVHDEDDDVDMIPLIDISLVLLIFFMMTSTAAYSFGLASIPESKYGSQISGTDAMAITIAKVDNKPVFSISKGGAAPEDGDRDLKSETDVVRQLKAHFVKYPGDKVEIRVAADRDLSYGAVKKLAIALEQFRASGNVYRFTSEVSDKSQ